ncbi:MAG: ABC transporter substrate-binding protein [Arcobacter sp.]|nr:MAG: ABC transporter substrate-binding protein [Arcobacter sp.]
MPLIFFLLFSLSLNASERIIALAPSISEIVFALGKGDELVGVSEYASYPSEVQEITKIGGYSNPSLEKIFSLNPSLVIGQSQYNKTLAQLNKLGIKTLSLEMKTINEIKHSITQIATSLNTDPSPLLEPIDRAIKQAQGKPTTDKKILIVYGLSLDINRGLYIAGHEIFYEDIIHLCGAKNAYESNAQSQPVLHYEGLLALNPDRVILLHHNATDGEVDFTKAKELWYNIPINAGVNKDIIILSKDYLSIPSHRIAQSIITLCEAVSK